ncbi:hypothetical protein [Streptomyces klenkii]|uniref:hypothetical protein n=1 Tax=Streptomyces klenkii TaxID=1420899 RepID=UPI0011C38325|nr:hypothetical protein [Streptomyces klenkii]
MTDVPVIVGGLGRVRLELVVEAVAVLVDPALPGTPWTAQAIAEALPDLVEMAAGGSLAVPATTLRWLGAIWAGEELPEE